MPLSRGTILHQRPRPLISAERPAGSERSPSKSRPRRVPPPATIRSCADLLKSGAPLLLYLYLYYAFDNRPPWFRWIWRLSNAARLLIRRLPPRPKQLVTDLVALSVYLPLSRLAALAEAAGLNVAFFPLSYYRHCNFYIMRIDQRDRFGIPLEQRFSRAQLRAMCTAAGLVNL